MPRLALSTAIAAPPELVFRLAADVAGAPRIIPGIKAVEVLTPGPPGKGTRWRETRRMFGKDATETLEFTEFEPGRRFAVGALSCGAEYRWEFRFTPEGGGTRLDLTLETRAVSLGAKLMSVLAPLFMGAMRKCMEADVAALKRAAEAAARG